MTSSPKADHTTNHCLGLSAVFVLLCLICACDLFDDDRDDLVVEGTVQFTHLEGGCWYILATDGTVYEPVSLPKELERPGLHVRLVVRPLEHRASVCQIGCIVEIVTILEVGPAPPPEDELCQEGGGRWDPRSCGHYWCGRPPDCDALIPGCDCGPSRNFVPGIGCVEDSECP